MLEVAEKGVLWLEFTVQGKQSHASRPDRGVNAFRAAARLVYLLDKEMHARFERLDHLYESPYSTSTLQTGRRRVSRDRTSR